MALGDIGDPAAIDALCDVLRDGKLGAFAATALGKIGDQRAVPALAEAARTSLAYDPEPAIIAIARIGGANARGTASAVGRASTGGASAVGGSGTLGSPGAVEALSLLFAMQQEPGRVTIMRWAADAAHADAVGLLLRGAADESREVRKLANEGLRELAWDTVAAGLRALLLLPHPESTVHRRALELAPIYARADADMRARIDRALNDDSGGDAEFRQAADEAWRGLQQLDAITAYQPSPAASPSS